VRNLLVMVIAILWETIRHPLRDIRVTVQPGPIVSKEPLPPDHGWLEGEREADADIAAGRVTHYNSTEEFLASLE